MARSGWAWLPLILSGGTALGLEVLWTRRLMDLLGANVESSARVFGCFFLGAALGSGAAALALPGIRRPWRSAAWAGFGVVLLSFPALLLPFWCGPLWPAIGPERLAAWQGAGLRSAVSILVVLPPAFLMGMTLPLATAAACHSGRSDSRSSIRVYTAYTLGGALGLAAVSVWTLPSWGLTGSLLFLGGMQLVAAVWFLKLDHEWHALFPAAVPAPLARGAESGLSPGLALVLSFCSGAGVMALEVLGLQLLNLKTPVAFHPQAALLCCTVFLLAAAAALVPWAVNRWDGYAQILPFCLAGAGLAIAASPPLFLRITGSAGGLTGHGEGFGAFLLTLAGVTLLTFGPAIILAGFVFPLLMGATQPRAGARSVGANLGTLLAVNGVGGILGAEIAYRVLLPALGVHRSLAVLGAGYGLLALAVCLLSGRRAALPLGFGIVSTALIALLFGTVIKRLPLFLRSATFDVLEVRSGREGMLAVVERPDLGRAIFFDNHYMLGCTRAAPDMQRQAHVPLLLHPEPKRVCFIGLGTGITASGALKHEAVEFVTIYELSQLVAETAGRYFGTHNEGLCSNPSVTLRVRDAGPQLAAAAETFDVIIGDLFTPWRPGEARLCSLEQFQAARQALRPGGVFCQWLPMTQLTQEQFAVIAATFQRVFGDVYLFRNHFRSQSLPLALVGFKEATLNWDVVARRCDSERKAGRLRDPACRHAEGVALLYLGACAPPQPGPLNTLENLRVELAVSRRILAGGNGDYLGGQSEAWLDFVQKQMAQVENDRHLPGSLNSLPELGVLLSRWESAADGDAPEEPSLKQAILAKLPASLLSDSEADWSLWPARNPKPPAP